MSDKEIKLESHFSVMKAEVLQYLQPQPSGVYLDVTLGGGGHTSALLSAHESIHVYGLDWDKQALNNISARLQDQFGERFHPLYGNFAHLYKLKDAYKLPLFDGILADFGTSRDQLVTARIGLSFNQDAPLDMRMSPGHHKITAAMILAKSTEKELADIFFYYGQERYSRKIARSIVEVRKHKPFKTTKQLAEFIEKVLGGKRGPIHPATRVFQALRIAVNHELDNIREFLRQVSPLLKQGGKLVCISFHSLEDRLVKEFYKQNSAQFIDLVPGVCKPSEEEVAQNRPSRSAILRALKKDKKSQVNIA